MNPSPVGDGQHVGADEAAEHQLADDDRYPDPDGHVGEHRRERRH